MLPERFGPYELIAPLGTGGMAETYVAVRRGPAAFEQKVCLKRILPAYAGEPGFVELFLDEARLLAQLRSGSIVQVYDFGEAEGTYYMALELVEGADLDGLMRGLARLGERIPPDVALYITAQLLTALEYAHNASAPDGQPLNVVHRDISPSNVLVSTHGEVKLTDFGIAKARGRKHKTQTGHTKGKLAYMSPEQVRGEALDGRSDLFAVGIVLFELLSGTHPFESDTDLTLLNNILTGKRPLLKELAPELDPAAILLVERLLSTNAKERPARASDALSMVPGASAAFANQKALAELVAQHVAHRPRPASRRVTPESSSERLPSGNLGANDGSTQIVPAERTGSGRVAYQAMATGSSEARPHGGGLRAWMVLSALVLMALAGAAWAWAVRDSASQEEATSAQKALDATDPAQVPAAREARPQPHVGQAREQDGRDLPTTTPVAPPVQKAEHSQPPQQAVQTSDQTLDEEPPEPRRRRTGVRRVRNDRAASSEPSATSASSPVGDSTEQPSGGKARSGLDVSADDF